MVHRRMNRATGFAIGVMSDVFGDTVVGIGVGWCDHLGERNGSSS